MNIIKMSSVLKPCLFLLALVCLWTCCLGNLGFQHMFFPPGEAGSQFQELDKHLMDVLPNNNDAGANIDAATKLLAEPAPKKSSLARLLKRKDKSVSVDKAVNSLITLNEAKSCTTDLLQAIGYIFKGVHIGSDARKSGIEGLTRINKIVNQLLTNELMEDCKKSLESLRQKLRAEIGSDESVAMLERELKGIQPADGYQSGGPSRADLAVVLFKLSKKAGIVLAQKRNLNGKLVEERDGGKLHEAAKRFFFEPCEKIVNSFEGLFTVVYELKSKYAKEEAFYQKYPRQLVETEFVYDGCRFFDRRYRNEAFKEQVFEHFLADQ